VSFVLGRRAVLEVEDGPYFGVSCEIDAIDSDAVLYMVVSLANAYGAAEGAAAEVAALRALYSFIESVGRPVWNLVDPKGPIPPDENGMLRVRTALMLRLVNLWTETYLPEPEPDPVTGPLKADIEKRARAADRTRRQPDA
jgi:hypothetical protein